NSENSAQMAQYAHTGMRMYFVGYFFAGFNIMAADYLSAVNRPAEASITSICRGMVAIVACSLVLSAVFGMPGVWAAFPASELLTALLTLFLLRRKESGKA
ncbi:MAG: polysaccharide biosynthesis C-terminal domain-containing protein, partial [Faecalibacterium prausnitzii]